MKKNTLIYIQWLVKAVIVSEGMMNFDEIDG